MAREIYSINLVLGTVADFETPDYQTAIKLINSTELINKHSTCNCAKPCYWVLVLTST